MYSNPIFAIKTEYGRCVESLKILPTLGMVVSMILTSNLSYHIHYSILESDFELPTKCVLYST